VQECLGERIMVLRKVYEVKQRITAFLFGTPPKDLMVRKYFIFTSKEDSFKSSIVKTFWLYDNFA